MTENFKQKLIELKELREKVQSSKAFIAGEKLRLLKELEPRETQTKELQKQMMEKDKEVRELALEIYDQDENCDLGYGVKVKECDTMDYEIDDAFAWAMEHKMALMLDVKEFEKIAKVKELDFVGMDKEPKVYLPTKIEVE